MYMCLSLLHIRVQTECRRRREKRGRDRRGKDREVEIKRGLEEGFGEGGKRGKRRGARKKKTHGSI